VCSSALSSTRRGSSGNGKLATDEHGTDEVDGLVSCELA